MSDKFNFTIKVVATPPLFFKKGVVILLEFVTIIKDERKKLGISRRQFAITCGISASYLGEIERGEKQNPSVETLEKIRKGLNHYSNREKFKLFVEDKECSHERS